MNIVRQFLEAAKDMVQSRYIRLNDQDKKTVQTSLYAAPAFAVVAAEELYAGRKWNALGLAVCSVSSGGYAAWRLARGSSPSNLG